MQLTRQFIRSQPLSLSNIRKISSRAFQSFDQEQTRNILISIGDTGTGKSTLLNSLILGPKKLVRKRVGRQGFVIDVESQDESIFEIGHSNSESETFLPKFHKMKLGAAVESNQINSASCAKSEDMFMVDVAGLNDTGGHLIEYVNQLINKKIFNHSILYLLHLKYCC